VGVLLAVAVDGLGEIPLPVEQADADEGQAEVGCGLAVIAGENAQAARVDGETLVQAVFGAEVGHQIRFRIEVLW